MKKCNLKTFKTCLKTIKRKIQDKAFQLKENKTLLTCFLKQYSINESRIPYTVSGIPYMARGSDHEME